MIEQRRYIPVEQKPQPHFGLVHAYYAMMGGFAFYRSYDDDTPKSLFEISTNPHSILDIPKFDALVYIMEHFPHVITDITEDYINDQAASSGLSKALLAYQVARFCMSCASRVSQGLPLSLLEVSTVAHSICTLLTIAVWWSKPINVAAPTIMREKAAQEVHALLMCSDIEYDKALGMVQKGAMAMPRGLDESKKIVLAAGALQHLRNPERPTSLSFKERDGILVPGRFGNTSSNENRNICVSIIFSPMVYGLLHVMTRSDQFPTPLEWRLWLVSSLVVSFSGLVGVCLGFPTMRLDGRHPIIGRTVKVLVAFIGLVIAPLAHVLASGFLIVESIRQLLFLDDAAYQLPSWSNYWPRLS